VLTNSDIVYLVKAHLSAELITALIQSSQPNFETTAAALTDLKAANVPDTVISVMVQASRSQFSQ
jgi:recombinational DNA repair protein (RecF pathway)